MEALINYGTINARSLDSAELPKKRQFCFARDDRNGFIQSFVGSGDVGGIARRHPFVREDPTLFSNAEGAEN